MAGIDARKPESCKGKSPGTANCYILTDDKDRTTEKCLRISKEGVG